MKMLKKHQKQLMLLKSCITSPRKRQMRSRGVQVTCSPNLGPGDMLEFGLYERRRNGQETLHSRTDHWHASRG